MRWKTVSRLCRPFRFKLFHHREADFNVTAPNGILQLIRRNDLPIGV
jgi:hypothetical protein